MSHDNFHHEDPDKIVGVHGEEFPTGPPRPFDEEEDPTEGGKGRDEIQEPESPDGPDFDDSPLPGVKAEDPDVGAEDQDLSDEQVARRLDERDDVDSGDGVLPEDRDRVGRAGDNREPRLPPFPPGR